MKIKHVTAAAALLLFYTISCKGPTGAQGPAGPSLTGSMTGFVTLVDQNDSLLNDRSGVSVSIDGTPDTTTTDSTGKWTLNNIQTGTYSITLSKAGFDTYKYVSHQFIGGGTDYLGNEAIIKEQTYSVTNLSAKDSITQTMGGFINVSGTMSAPAYSTGKKIVFFIGTSSAVSSAPATYSYVTTGTPPSISVGFNRNFSSAELVAAGFASGTTVYIVAYGTSEYYHAYPDLATGRVYFCGLSYTPSSVVSAVVP